MTALIKAPYDTISDYSEKAVPQKDAAEKLIILANIQPNEIILDAGCGPGHLSAKLAEKAKSVIGVDASKNMITEAKKFEQTRNNLKFHVSHLQELEYRNEFTLVFSNSVMHWVTEVNHNKVLDNFYNLLKPEGRIALQLVCGNPYLGLFHTIFKEFYLEYAQYYSQWKQPWFYPQNLAIYQKIVEKSGFSLVLVA